MFVRVNLLGCATAAGILLSAGALAVPGPAPVILHGTVAHVDRDGHRIGVAGLGGTESFWRQAASDVPVDPVVDLASVAVGQHVAVLLTRGTNGTYYVRKIAGQ